MILAIWLTIYLLAVAGVAYLWYRFARSTDIIDQHFADKLGSTWFEHLERDESEGANGLPKRVRVSQDRMNGL